MGVMNKNVYKDDDDSTKDLWDAILKILENEEGDHGEDDGEYGNYDKDSVDIYRLLQADDDLNMKQKLAA